MHRIFIDGQSGTTGLQIHDRLRQRQDIGLLTIADEDRKNTDVKINFIERADVVILCLPDDAARETVELAKGTDTRFLDASTAHRVNPDWIYGLAELHDTSRRDIKAAKFVSNPGCYPTGFLLAIAPLTAGGLLRPETRLCVNAVSGYSGGGHKMIDRYETRKRECPDDLWSSRPYALKFGHKHIPEMQHYASLLNAPLFTPSVGHYQQGMLVSIPLASEYFNGQIGLNEIYACLDERYHNEPCVRIHEPNTDALADGFLDPQTNNGTNRNDIFIFGSSDQFLLVSRLDNLGKGAAGAAVQNLNLMLGADELCGLEV